MGRLFRNTPPINDLTPPLPPAGIPFVALLLISEITPQIATDGFVSIDIAIESLMVDGKFRSNLFWAQLALQMPHSL
jgi:hypothetical protein